MVDKVYYTISLNLLLFMNSGAFNVTSQSNKVSLINLVMRAKRQAGYFYDRPNVAFDLPTRGTTATAVIPTSTTAPQAQQMYYAYPVPNPGSSTANDNSIVNIGFSNTGTVASSTTVSNAASAGSTGYNYAPQSDSATTPTSSGISSTAGTVSVATSSSPTSGSTGYGYNGPSSSPSSVSTKAPTYLPPTAINDIAPGSAPINLSPTVSTVPTIGISDSYLPPSGITSMPSISNPGSLLLQNPSTSYIPPNPSVQPAGTSPSPITGTSPASSTDSRGYLPPQESLKPDFISTPAPTYLPPLF